MCSWTPKESCPCSNHSHSINRLLMGLWSQPNTESSVYRDTYHTSIKSYTRHIPPNNCHRMPGLGVQHAADLGEQAAVGMRPASTRPENSFKGEHSFNSYVPQRPVFTNGNNCTPKLETRDPRMWLVLSWWKPLLWQWMKIDWVFAWHLADTLKYGIFSS